jgi:ribosomal-protein-alanine N-acetyltransferase
MSDYCWSSVAADDVDRLYLLERAAHAYPWSKTLLASNFTPRHFNQLICLRGDPAGFYIGQLAAGEATLLNLAVSPVYQGRGIGRQLLQHFLDVARLRGAEDAWLEVRESNQVARALYQGIGFNEITLRQNYYPGAKGREAAVIMNYQF